LFQLPDEAKENAMSAGLPYRSVFCVLTWDSVLVYDTYHAHPLAILSGLHYCNLVDAAWSDNGRTLFVCSTDGYVSIVQFEDGELGRVYVPPPPTANAAASAAAATTPPPTTSANAGRTPTESTPASTTSKPHSQRRVPVPSPGPPTLPPCEPGLASIEAPPCKRAKFQTHDDLADAAATASPNNNSNSGGAPTDFAASASPAAADPSLAVGDHGRRNHPRDAEDAMGIDQLTIHEPKAKKKRIQPTFIAAAN
jgi:hypothetical protein